MQNKQQLGDLNKREAKIVGKNSWSNAGIDTKETSDSIIITIAIKGSSSKIRKKRANRFKTLMQFA